MFNGTVCRTLRISCEAVPPSISPAGAQGGTSACSTGAALSFVSCIRLFGGSSRFPSRRWRAYWPTSAILALTNLRMSVAGRPERAEKRIVPGLVSYPTSSVLSVATVAPLMG